MKTSDMMVSVIIPCYNERNYIRGCIQSALSWDDTEIDFEVLIVDGLSTDGTREIVAEFVRDNKKVRMIDNPGALKPVAMNVGIESARGDWIVRLDAHSYYPIDYLQRLLETAHRTGADNVGGIVVPQLAEETISATIVQALTTHRFGVGNSTFRLNPKEGPAETVPFGFYRKSVFRRIGYFDERLAHSQDFEFNQRLLSNRGTIWINPNIKIRYFNQTKFSHFIKKAYSRDGHWLPYMWYVAPYSFKMRHSVPLVFCASSLISILLFPFVAQASTILFAIMVPYCLLAIFASIQQASRFRQPLLALLLPLSFLAYHFSHGLGSIAGLCKIGAGMSPVQRQKRGKAEQLGSRTHGKK